MRLKSLTLSGFKSFVDPTRIDFSDGISAIIGPNGCGKSNIVDAIRWCLGEHSARQLRGGVMDDLIFQGSSTRPAVSLCDVELVFQCAVGSLPAPYHELDSIRVRRRQMRDGGSDARINDRPVRLKDIHELFLGTGISTRAYAIIEQGAIARMITAKPEERRQLLEEAAGVVKYRSRRRDTEQKISLTEQNLERVLDVQQEVAGQCRSLKQQAARAEQFTALQQELADAKNRQMVWRCRQLAQQQAQLNEDLQIARSNTAQAVAALSQQQRVFEQWQRSRLIHEEELQAAHDTLLALEQERGLAQQQAERQAGQQRVLEERLSSLELAIDQNRQQHRQYEEDLHRHRNALAALDDSTLQQHYTATCQQREQQQQDLRQARQQRDGTLAAYEQERAILLQQQQQQQKQQAIFQGWQQRLDQCEQQQQALRARSSEQQQKLTQAEQAVRDSEAQWQAAQQQRVQRQRQWDAAKKQRQQAVTAHEEAQHATRSMQRELADLRQQRGQLGMDQQWHRKLEKLGVRWVDDIALSIPPGLELAVAAALQGEVADGLLPPSPDRALQQACHEAGQQLAIAWYEHSTCPAVTHSMAQALGLADDHPLYPLFSRTALVDDVYDAEPVSSHRLVSRDGWRRESDGWIIPPRPQHSTRLWLLQQRIEQAGQQLAQAEEHTRQTATALTAASAQLRQAEQDFHQHEKRLRQCEEQRRSAANQHHHLQHETDSLHRRMEHLQQEMDELKLHAPAAPPDAGDRQRQQQTLHALHDTLEQHSLQQQQCEQRWQESNLRCAELEKQLALHQQQREHREQQCREAEQQMQRLQQQQQTQRQEWQNIQQEKEALRQQRLDNQQLSRLAEQLRQAQQQVQDLRQQDAGLLQQITESEAVLQQCRSVWLQAEQEQHRVEAARNGNQSRQQELEHAIRQQHQQSAAALCERYRTSNDAELERAVAGIPSLEQQLARFGAVNLLAVQEYAEANERADFLTRQVDDIQQSLEVLRQTIQHIDETTRQRFRDVFDATNQHFQSLFPRLFGGGHAALQWDGNDLLTAGIDVIAQPPGKRLQTLGLLSGGEKALTAVALVFAIFHIRPAPFCILDEVDAPLDDANTHRFAELITELSGQIQFLAISHNKITMKHAATLLGVSMPEAGVSKIIRVVLDDYDIVPQSSP